VFVIVDPFDNGYNPAKVLKKGSDLENRYFIKFRETFNNLKEGKFNNFNNAKK